jgi:type IV secretory pathway VirJ component
MFLKRIAALALILASAPLAYATPLAVSEDSLRLAPFGTVNLYSTSATPSRVVLFISGDGGWNRGVVDMARRLAGLDALVAGVDITHYLRAVGQSGEACAYPAGDLEELSRAVQLHARLRDYVRPILAGYSSGATLVYVALVEAPATTFQGGLSLGFCPDLEVSKPFCRGSGLAERPLAHGRGFRFAPAESLTVPWIALQGTIDQVCDADSTVAYMRQVRGGEVVLLPKVGHGYAVPANWMPQFEKAFQQIAAAAPAEPESTIANLPDLPLIEVPATGGSRDLLGLHITGDGGWGVTDKGLARALAAQGIPVVGLNALRYFWKERNPDETAADVARILRHYLAAWHRNRVLLIGYSYGADVLPFVVARLPEDLRARVALVVLLGPSTAADFRFHVGNWVGRSSSDALPVRPEIEKLKGTPILCFAGAKDSGAICDELPPGLVTPVTLSGGHRIGSNFSAVAREILDRLP